jgi:hypothetical protein
MGEEVARSIHDHMGAAMRPEEKVAFARAIAENPLFAELMNDMEKAAVNRCVNAAPMAAEVRAIRKFRSSITSMSEDASATNTGAPA